MSSVTPLVHYKHVGVFATQAQATAAAASVSAAHDGATMIPIQTGNARKEWTLRYVEPVATPAAPVSARAAPRPNARYREQGCELVLYREHASDTVYGGIYNPKTRLFVEGYELAATPSVYGRRHLCAHFGEDMPDTEKLPMGGFVFEPGDFDLVKRSPGRVRVNTWQPTEVQRNAVPSTVCPQNIRTLLAHVLGGSEEVIEWTLDWLAYILQTWKRPGTGLILRGCEGTGKNLLTDYVLAPLFGELTTTHPSGLLDQFNGWIEGKLFVVINEGMTEERKSAGQQESKLRPLITDETIRLRVMRQDARDIPNPVRGVIITSNEMIPVGLSGTDRRYSVGPYQAKPLAQVTDTEKLVAAIKRELPAFCGYLKQRKVNAARVRTPVGEVERRDMQEASSTVPRMFASALAAGNLAWFMGEYSELTQEAAGRAHYVAFRAVLEDWLKAALAGEPSYVTASQLAEPYNWICAPGERDRMAARALGSFLGRHAQLEKVKDAAGMRGRAYRIKWRISPEEAKAHGAMLAEDRANYGKPHKTTEETT